VKVSSLDDALHKAGAELDAFEANALADTEATLMNHGASEEELQITVAWQRDELVKLRAQVMEMIRVAWWTGCADTRVH
jgi:hypothetical protein